MKRFVDAGLYHRVMPPVTDEKTAIHQRIGPQSSARQRPSVQHNLIIRALLQKRQFPGTAPGKRGLKLRRCWDKQDLFLREKI